MLACDDETVASIRTCPYFSPHSSYRNVKFQNLIAETAATITVVGRLSAQVAPSVGI